MKEIMWKAFAAWLVSSDKRVQWLIDYGMRHPWYGIDGIMSRYWLFNPYDEDGGNGGKEKKRSWLRNFLPSIRLHCIYGSDPDRHLHDHPWDCRTIILRGCYWEMVLNQEHEPMLPDHPGNFGYMVNMRSAGDTKAFKPLEWHKVDSVDPSGVWTMFITWKYKGPWGFLVDGKKMLSRDYFEYRKQWREK